MKGFSKLNEMILNLWKIEIVATLALGSRPRQGVVRLQAKKGARESCHMLPRM